MQRRTSGARSLREILGTAHDLLPLWVDGRRDLYDVFGAGAGANGFTCGGGAREQIERGALGLELVGAIDELEGFGGNSVATKINF